VDEKLPNLLINIWELFQNSELENYSNITSLFD